MPNALNLSASEVIDAYGYKMGLAPQDADFSCSAAIGLFRLFIGFLLIMATGIIARMVSDSGIW